MYWRVIRIELTTIIIRRIQISEYWCINREFNKWRSEIKRRERGIKNEWNRNEKKWIEIDSRNKRVKEEKWNIKKRIQRNERNVCKSEWKTKLFKEGTSDWKCWIT